MLRKNRFLTLPAIVAALILTLQCSANAFEIFPRPEDQYTVQRGQNLHGLAGFYYGNPALWPFLWNQEPIGFHERRDKRAGPTASSSGLQDKSLPQKISLWCDESDV